MTDLYVTGIGIIIATIIIGVATGLFRSWRGYTSDKDIVKSIIGSIVFMTLGVIPGIFIFYENTIAEGRIILSVLVMGILLLAIWHISETVIAITAVQKGKD